MSDTQPVADVEALKEAIPQPVDDWDLGPSAPKVEILSEPCESCSA